MASFKLVVHLTSKIAPLTCVSREEGPLCWKWNLLTCTETMKINKIVYSASANMPKVSNHEK
jgi:hypothetical protein